MLPYFRLHRRNFGSDRLVARAEVAEQVREPHALCVDRVGAVRPSDRRRRVRTSRGDREFTIGGSLIARGASLSQTPVMPRASLTPKQTVPRVPRSRDQVRK
jgi:hypothetical protein